MHRVLCDVERWPQWTSTVSRAMRLNGGAFRVGSHVLVKQPKFGTNIWEVAELVAGCNFTWETKRAGMRLTASHLIEPRGAGCQVSLSFDVSGHLSWIMLRLYGRLIQQYVATEAEGLKRRCEAGIANLYVGRIPPAGHW